MSDFGEVGDDLLAISVDDGEILGLQTPNRPLLFVEDSDIDFDQLSARTEDRALVLLT